MRHTDWLKDPRYEVVTAFREKVKRDAINLRQRKEWKDKAKKFKEGKTCFCCGSSNNLAVHHESNKEYELLLDDSCIVLCKGCHYLRHHGMSLSQITQYYTEHPRTQPAQ